ncbi:MAG: hypothetical protein LH609_07300 [Rudanella sp.]|nr:hypothetical protein [Rudanella sp.]
MKKISFTNADTQSYGWGVPGTTHLISFWGSLGVTDPGSSGSPLFDGNRRIVGQLQGGPSFCGATGTGLRDYYGRFFTSWTGGGTNTSRLSNWLDSDNSSGTTTNGVKPALSGPVSVSGVGNFSLNTLNSSIVSWSVAGGTGLVSPTSGMGNAASLTAPGDAASLTITFSVNDGQPYPIRFSKEFSTSAPATTIGGSLSLLTPIYSCATGAITFTIAGGDGTPVTYSAVGVQRASATSNTGTVEIELRADPKPLTIRATQRGVSVSYLFDFAAFCSGLTPPVSPTVTQGGSLSLLLPTYNCTTGVITFNPIGGDGSTITYTAVGVQRASLTSNTGTVEAGLRADPKPLVIVAMQTGVTVSQPFDFAAYCGLARMAQTEPEPDLQIRVLGNPGNRAATFVEIRGAEGQSLNLRLMDATGRQQSEWQVEKAGKVEVVRMPPGRSAGTYVLEARTASQRQTARILTVD